MPRKKSTRTAADRFGDSTAKLGRYYDSVLDADLSEQETTWAVEAAVIKLYAHFEVFVLHALVAAINNDTTTISAKTGVSFPRHLTDEVCEFIVTGGSFFDFRGRPGLIKTLKSFLPDDHYLVSTVKHPYYKDALEQLIALRNLAAHESSQAKRVAQASTGSRLGSAGAWLKVQNRFPKMVRRLKELGDEIAAEAPY